METITIQTKDGHEYQVKVEVKEITDHLLRFTIDEGELRPIDHPGVPEPKINDTIIRQMDQGPWTLTIIDVESGDRGYCESYICEILAETEGLKKVQRRKK